MGSANGTAHAAGPRERQPQRRDDERPGDGRSNGHKEGSSNRRADPNGQAGGHSGYGVDSLRPHLQDQLVMKDLLRPQAARGRQSGRW